MAFPGGSDGNEINYNAGDLGREDPRETEWLPTLVFSRVQNLAPGPVLFLPPYHPPGLRRSR